MTFLTGSVPARISATNDANVFPGTFGDSAHIIASKSDGWVKSYGRVTEKTPLTSEIRSHTLDTMPWELGGAEHIIRRAIMRQI